MRFQLIAASLMATTAFAADQCFETFQNGIKVKVCGEADGSYSINPVEGKFNGAADGTIEAQIDGFGTVTLEGSVNGKGSYDADSAEIFGFASGRVNAPDVDIAGALAASGQYNRVTGDVSGNGAFAGRASAFGYGFSGAVNGVGSRDAQGNVKFNGAVNGCYKQPEGHYYCLNEQGQFTGIVTISGSFIPGALQQGKFVPGTWSNGVFIPNSPAGTSTGGSQKPSQPAQTNPGVPVANPQTPGDSSSASGITSSTSLLAVVFGAAVVMI